MDNKLGPLELFVSAFAITSVAGLAALLRSKKPLSWRSVTSAFLYSGMNGLAIALISYHSLGVKNPYFLLGVCGLAGIGGMTVIDFVVQLWKNGGIELTLLRPKQSDEDKEDEDK